MANIQHLSAQLGQALKARGWKITCAESCTGGGIGYAITETSGSSAYFEQGFITYSNDAKQELLGVDAITLRQHGAVSETVVKQMAHGALIKAGADVAISVSGIAGPDGGTSTKPVGTVWFGFVLPLKKYAVKQLFSGDRQSVREQATAFALEHMTSLIEAFSDADC